MSFGPWQAPATNTPSVIVATGSSLGCRSVYQPAMLQEMPHFRPISLASACGSSAAHEDHHIDRDAPLPAHSVSSTCTISLPASLGQPGGVGHFGHLAADEVHPLFQQPLVELLVVLLIGPHVDVERIHLGLGLFQDEVPELQSRHAADAEQ